ncbi:ABC transporter permease [Opitutus sp. ER46]|uniref:ABC transporter permease n=1 Tax=Opitutus sp. ER46 TaxID=2161864 RepID=UPI000D2F70A1|nr:ABC transporter permease [Opitutus sp. ER46]PTX94557.1 multidrug ABC transporter substrate-binding protein [Opitutus sp. ER46]
MRFTNIIRVALRALRRNLMRSILTALGIIIGIAAVITTVSMGTGAKAQIEAQVAALGQNIITVFPNFFSAGGVRSGFGGAITLTPEDAEAIQSEVAEVDGVSPEIRDRAQVLANGLNWNTQVLGESPDYVFIRSWPIAEGVMFSDQDVKSVAKVCVVGRTIVDQLFPDGTAIGQTLRIRNLPFRIVGVLSPKGYNINGSDQDDVVIIPYTSHMKRVSRRANINTILVQASRPDRLDKVKQDIEDVLTQRRKGRDPDFIVRTQEEIAQTATQTSRTLTLLLGGVALVSLIVGGIGVMNIMLVSVTERTREIGIRLAIGAHGRDVLAQFLIEATMLSVLGGVLGILTGVAASKVITIYWGLPTLVSPASIFVAVGVSTAIGVFFGFYPARKAAQLDPIEALRYE